MSERECLCRRSLPTSGCRSFHGPSQRRGTCSGTGICQIHHNRCDAARNVAGGVMTLLGSSGRNQGTAFWDKDGFSKTAELARHWSAVTWRTATQQQWWWRRGYQWTEQLCLLYSMALSAVAPHLATETNCSKL
ncbi:hypothetical protein ISCGN_002129 [Ixodes scapularis]